jgi:hypothetical protein
MVASVHLDSLSLASNNLGSGLQGIREEDTVNQNRDPMDIEEPNPPHSDTGDKKNMVVFKLNFMNVFQICMYFGSVYQGSY